MSVKRRMQESHKNFPPEIRKILEKNKSININVRLSHDEEVYILNKEYLGRDYPTDVLSFNMDELDGDLYFLGDVVVNVDQAERQAKEYGNTTLEEIFQLIQHGILHLFGIHHDGDN